MKKIVCGILSAFLVSGGAVMAQGEMDAYRLSQRDINGTARYLGMGGAFGALGGDVSVMATNPAGLGVYRTSEIVTSVSLNMINTNTSLNGNSVTGDKTRFNLDNFSYVGYFPTGNDEGIIGWNFGFSYHRLKNFTRTYNMVGKQPSSLSDYIADIAYGIPESQLGAQNAYDRSDLHWLPVLGYGSWLIDPTDKNDNSYESPYLYLGYPTTNLLVKEKGGIDQYNFSFATNISDLVYIGGTFVVTDLNYKLMSYHDESFTANDYFYLDNYLSTNGTGYAFNLGTIVRPAEFLRLGVAYNSPTWYKLTDRYDAYAETVMAGDTEKHSEATPNYMYTPYRFRTADRWIFSAAGIIGTKALISVDYELSNYRNSRLSDEDGYHYADNDYIKEDFRNTNAIRVGAEYKVTPQFSVRAGGSWESSSAEQHLQNGDVEVLTAGTVAHYTVDKGRHSYSVGFGYRFTPNFYMDMAYVYRQHKENLFPYSQTFLENGDPVIEVDPASLKTNTNRIALTLGYKF